MIGSLPPPRKSSCCSRKVGNLACRKFQVRAYRISTAAGRSVKAIDQESSRRTVVGRFTRSGADVEPRADCFSKPATRSASQPGNLFCLWGWTEQNGIVNDETKLRLALSDVTLLPEIRVLRL